MPTAPDSRAPGRDACLVLMFKAPERSKSRLGAEIGGRAVAVARHLVACALEDLERWDGPVSFAPARATDREWLDGIAHRPGAVVEQRGSNLGQRINHVNRALRGLGFERQLFIGIDCPTIAESYLAKAAAALGEHDAVLGPAEDGGVVLMGVNGAWPDLAGLGWSTSALGTELEALCSDRGSSVARLATLADIDSARDLDGLAQALRDDRRPARRAFKHWLDSAAIGEPAAP
jgi:glycosyltransferase A (GT-A) superfamily protein (DUF2064 family)